MGYLPSLMPSFGGNLLTELHEICSQETRLYASMWENLESLSHLGLVWYWVVTDGQNYDS